MPKQLTLEEIGSMAGVSRATVSRVVNNYPHVSQEVRERVQQVINQTGYQPNLAARSLASNRSNILGLIIPNVMSDIFADPYYSMLIQGIAEACYSRDYTLSLFLLHTKKEEERTLQRVLGTGFIDGLLLTADPSDSQLSQQIARKQKPFVQIGRPQLSNEISYVDVDNTRGAYTAVMHLLQLGYKRIALIGSNENTAGEDRSRGYRHALQEYGYDWRSELVAIGDFSEQWGNEAMHRLLTQQPDAVFTASDRTALGAIRAIHEAGLRIPDDIAVVGFDDLESSQTTNPPLTTVRQPVRRSGQLAAEMLVNIVTNGADPVRHLILPTELIVRRSCGAMR
jgi:LacI family transcriptional regulator